MYSQESIAREFLSTVPLYFLTFKSEKHQKIDFLRKRLLKHSNLFLIVRERNKMTTGYHFHALIRMAEKPNAKFYIKGAHMHLLEVGKRWKGEFSEPTPKVKDPKPLPMATTNKEIEQAILDGIATDADYEDLVEEKAMKKGQKDLKMLENIKRVLHYMSKEAEMPAQYTDYVYVVNRKNQKVAGC